MLPFFITILFLTSNLAFSHDQGIARVNFFPDTSSWLTTSYTHTDLEIETPQETLQTKEVENHYNLFTLSFAHRFTRKLFVGAQIGFNEASENAATHGLPFRRRFTSSGLIDPEFFGNYRLRFQKEDRGSIDMNLTLIPSPGPRRISRSTMNHFSGQNSLRLQFSHGFLEEKWEFRNLLGTTMRSDGREENEFLGGRHFEIKKTYVINYAFTTQYSLKENLFLAGTVGVIYRSTEVITESAGEKRQIRSGTGSLFRVDLKYKLSEVSLVEVGYALQRREYFVKAETFNLEGDSKSHQSLLNYINLF